jgi:hypothetical protein
MTNTKYNGTLNISQYFITIDINVPYSKILLENAFPLLTVKQIEKPWHENHYRYAPTWKFFEVATHQRRGRSSHIDHYEVAEEGTKVKVATCARTRVAAREAICATIRAYVVYYT